MWKLTLFLSSLLSSDKNDPRFNGDTPFIGGDTCFLGGVRCSSGGGDGESYLTGEPLSGEFSGAGSLALIGRMRVDKALGFLASTTGSAAPRTNNMHIEHLKFSLF